MPSNLPYPTTRLPEHELERHIQRLFSEYHAHAKVCRTCRHPRESYEARQNNCSEGNFMTKSIAPLLYDKARHYPAGHFVVRYNEGWYEVGEWIEVICHNHQGQYTKMVINLDRAVPSSHNHTRVSVVVNHQGSAMAEEQERMRRMRERESSTHHRRRDYSPTHLHPPTTSTFNLGTYPSPPASPRISNETVNTDGSRESRRSVRFNKTVHVREFYEE
ncbi:hypothetical protein EX30DRAFT_351215 [Ascodesmis nigricans]|uniref:Uncharacterized protein n=1 Tax=Ascodesmis nigricans TaxID=341454 RepID=A0A4S2MM67_9PEZI|nr:hypothetical protein EX30DRAFT_351215 [Ascodesmis nigricans]